MMTSRLLKLASTARPAPVASMLAAMVVMLVTMLPVLPAHAGPEMALVQSYPAKSISSVARADAALVDARPVREAVEQIYLDEQAACYERFLVSSCLADAKDKRRKSLQQVRRIEVEAHAFLRKDKADERDRAVAERQAKAAAGGTAIPFAGTAREGAEANDGKGESQLNPTTGGEAQPGSAPR